MPISVLARHLLGDTVALYRHDAASGRVGLSLVPLAAGTAAVADWTAQVVLLGRTQR